MDKISIDGFFYFGTAMRYLQDAREGISIFNDGCILQNISSCLRYFDELGLTVTKLASFELTDFHTELNKIKDKTATLSKEQALKLTGICNTLRHTLMAELMTHEAFVVTPKRFDVSKLLDDIGSLMSPDVFISLPEITKYDLSEAGKCIAFERPTAVVFHLMRATEAVLRAFYCTFINRKRVSPLLWGNMVQDLRKRPKTKRHITLYNNLDNIRHSFRNPTQHPDAIYDIHEAQDLCPLCFEVINRMCKILNKS